MSENIKELHKIDRLLHEPARLMIAAILFPLESADFVYLLSETGLTKGNLSAHLTKLEEGGYVEIEKTFRGKVPRTVISLTDDGREAFSRYREQLRRTAASLPQ